MISFLWAQDQHGLIGKDGTLPWHLPDDLHFFKSVTINQIMVMGRKTFEGMGKKPLPNRTNIVLTHQPEYSADDGVIVYHSAESVLDYAASFPDKNLVIVGGAHVFASFKGIPDVLYVTRLAGSFEGDTYMTDIDFEPFDLITSRTVENDDPALTHTFEAWVRRDNHDLIEQIKRDNA
ncbi:dihydrofolate reductase [Lacticaseibacillus saniviri]|uniref:Dihydrofolate reductase n=2 Tax=Lacticaseibacillus saniviri TaxID=931533 RepID=A0A0R2N1K5_9LACO|nr:dihydrofolate reductase [Lacticaseibacillus saniviri]KRO18272.1 dihydrofolate reductase [Lacticaseibacillus saniviri JCM 17471 = DSM 24301]